MARHHRRRFRLGWFVPLALLAGGYLATSYVFGHQPVSEATGLPQRHPQHHHHVDPHSVNKASAFPTHYLIHVPPLDQYPQLPNGCEVTSLTMLMTAVGHPMNKMTLAQEMPKDPTRLVLTSTTNANGQVVHHVKYWGNPNVGFVGSVYQSGEGYGIYHGPMFHFLNQLLPGRAEDLTGDSFSTLLHHVAQGIPVEAWTTTTFQPTNDWVTWQSPEGPVTATPLEHAVLIVGYGPGTLYVNNPLNGEAAEKVPEGPFIQSWRQLGKQAITVKATKS